MIMTVLQSYRKQQGFHKPTGSKPLTLGEEKKERRRGLVLKSILSSIWIIQNMRSRNGLDSLANKWAEAMKGSEKKWRKKIEKKKIDI